MKLLTVLFFIPFFGSCQKLVLGEISESSGIVFAGKTTVFIGNSITRGVDASPLADNRWTTLFCDAKSSTQDNNGVDGMTMINACGFAIFDTASIPSYVEATHAALFISLGENDIGFNSGSGTSTDSAFKAAYTTAVQAAINTYGWPPELIILLTVYNPFSWNTYVGGCGVSVAANDTRVGLFNTAITEVANENGCMLIDIYTEMEGLGSEYFASDGLHPNNAGHTFIANYLINIL